MSKTKATGLDDISVNVLQLAAPAITPCPSIKAYQDVNDLIINISFINYVKILEKHVFTHLYAFLQKHKLLAEKIKPYMKRNIWELLNLVCVKLLILLIITFFCKTLLCTCVTMKAPSGSILSSI